MYRDTAGKFEQEQCNVCCEEFEGEALVRELPECGHVFHSECIKMWCERQRGAGFPCPLCKVEIAVIGVGGALYENAMSAEASGRHLIVGLPNPGGEEERETDRGNRSVNGEYFGVPVSTQV